MICPYLSPAYLLSIQLMRQLNKSANSANLCALMEDHAMFVDLLYLCLFSVSVSAPQSLKWHHFLICLIICISHCSTVLSSPWVWWGHSKMITSSIPEGVKNIRNWLLVDQPLHADTRLNHRPSDCCTFRRPALILFERCQWADYHDLPDYVWLAHFLFRLSERKKWGVMTAPQCNMIDHSAWEARPDHEGHSISSAPHSNTRILSNFFPPGRWSLEGALWPPCAQPALTTPSLDLHQHRQTCLAVNSSLLNKALIVSVFPLMKLFPRVYRLNKTSTVI